MGSCLAVGRSARQQPDAPTAGLVNREACCSCTSRSGPADGALCTRTAPCWCQRPMGPTGANIRGAHTQRPSGHHHRLHHRAPLAADGQHEPWPLPGCQVVIRTACQRTPCAHARRDSKISPCPPHVSCVQINVKPSGGGSPQGFVLFTAPALAHSAMQVRPLARHLPALPAMCVCVCVCAPTHSARLFSPQPSPCT